MSKVYLVGVTHPVLLANVDTPEELIAYTARVSNPGNQINKETAPKLLKYLVKHSHWSPFEMVSLVMGIETTRDIARQILRHRSFSFQEFSQRYADAGQLGFEIREARLQDNKNRQNSLPTDDGNLKSDWHTKQEKLVNLAKETYNWALFNGIAKEQARAVLPEGLTHSVLYMSGTLRSWIHYCELRTDPGTQKEHREVAESCKQIILNQFPSLTEVLSKD
jgi:thymidylate synthase (FAD)